MLLGTLFAFVKNLLFFQVLVVPWVVLFIAAFVYVLLFPSYLRPNRGTDVQHPTIHRLHTAGAGFLVIASLELLPSTPMLAAAICAFITGNFVVSVTRPLMFTNNAWDAYYRFLGWSGFGTSVLSLSFRLVAAQRDREKEYSLILGLNLVPMVVGFAVGVFVLNFLLIPKVQARVAAFFQEFPTQLKVEQSREMLLYASLLLLVGSANRYVGFVTTLGACVFFWFASMMIHYTNAEERFQEYVNYFVATYGLAACFCSAFLRYTSFRVDATKAYSIHAILLFFAGLINVSVAVLGNFTSAIRIARQHRILAQIEDKDVHYPSRAAILMSAVSLIASTTENSSLVPAARVGLSIGSSIGFGLSVFLKTIPKPKKHGGFFREWKRFQDRLEAFFLLSSASLSVVNTYCLVYATFVLDKEKSAEVISVVMNVSTFCNFVLGHSTLVFVILFENYDRIKLLKGLIVDAYHYVAAEVKRLAKQVLRTVRRIYNSRLIRTMLTRIAEGAAALAEAALAWSIRMSEMLRLYELYENVVLLLERVGDWFVQLGEQFLQQWDRMWWFIETRAKAAMRRLAVYAARVRSQFAVMLKSLRPYVERVVDLIARLSKTLDRVFMDTLKWTDAALNSINITKRERGLMMVTSLFCSSYGVQAPATTLFAASILLVTPKLYSVFMFDYLLGSALALTLRKPGSVMHVLASVLNGMLAVAAVFADTDKGRQKRQAAAAQGEEGPSWAATMATISGCASMVSLSASFFIQQPEQKFVVIVGAQMFAVASIVIKNILWFPRRWVFVEYFWFAGFALTLSSVLYEEGLRTLAAKEMYIGLTMTSLALGINALTAFAVAYFFLVRIARG